MNKRTITILLFLILAIAVLLMGVMEKTLSSIGGTPAVVAGYAVIAVILVILYIRARKQ